MCVLASAGEDTMLFVLLCLQIRVLISQSLSPLVCLPSGVSSGCEIRGSYGPGAHLTFRPKDRPQDDDARGRSCRP